MSISKRFPTPGDDRGNALVMVIGLGFTFLVLALSMAMSASFAATTSTSTRAGVQTQAAADAGIDNAVKALNNVIIGKESSFKCQISSSVTTAQGTADVVTSIGYHLAGAGEDSPYVCNAATAIADGTDVIGAQMISKATLRIASTDGGKTVTRSVKQTVQRSPEDPRPPLFKYGFFSNGGLSTTNNFTVDGGGVFTNGNFKCNSNAQVFGDVVAIGTASLTNNCYMTSLWAGGQTSCSAGAFVDGDVAVASSMLTYTTGCKVSGNVWTKGDVKFNGTTVMGNALSAQGSVILESGSSILGWAQAATNVKVNGSSVGSARVENLPSDPPASPVNQKMPTIYWSDLTGAKAGSPAVVSYGAWIKENATANGAMWYSKAFSGAACVDSDFEAAIGNWSLGGHLVGPATPTIIDARACDVKFGGGGGWNPLKLTVRADTTLVVKSFTSSNGLLIKGADPSKKYVVRIIVPLPEGAQSCTGAGAGRGNITVNSGGTEFDSNVATFVYTNGTAELTNGVKFHGSLYACGTNVSVDTHVTYADGTPPGMTDDGEQKYAFTPVMRFDVRP